jgi:hypothetical protein
MEPLIFNKTNRAVGWLQQATEQRAQFDGTAGHRDVHPTYCFEMFPNPMLVIDAPGSAHRTWRYDELRFARACSSRIKSLRRCQEQRGTLNIGSYQASSHSGPIRPRTIATLHWRLRQHLRRRDYWLGTSNRRASNMTHGAAWRQAIPGGC